MSNNFAKKLNLGLPIIAPAPMDGVTDAVFRHIIAKYSSPSFIVTEFTNVEGLARGAVEMLKAFIYEEAERPIIAQIYGVEVESFYKAAVMLCYLGFDGIDINMGCPVNKVARHGSGAGLIKTPKLAKKIIRAVKNGVKDFSEGISMEKAGVHENIIGAIEEKLRPRVEASLGAHKETCEGVCGAMRGGAHKDFPKKILPVSVKTRIGYDSVIAEEWASILLEEKPDMICMHGRTLKQMYAGEANWDAIKSAGKIVRQAGVTFLGNGDVSSMQDALEKIQKYEVDGVLVGRAVCGNPWFFGRGEVVGNHNPLRNAILPEYKLKNEPAVRQKLLVNAGAPVVKSEKNLSLANKIVINAILPEFKLKNEPAVRRKLLTALEHATYMYEKAPELNFLMMRKHLAWYCKGFDGAKELRMQLMKVENLSDVDTIISGFLGASGLRIEDEY